MPALILNGEHAHDSLSVQAVMLWPGEDQEGRRRQFFAAQQAQKLIKAGEANLQVSAELLNTLLDTPRWSDLTDEVVLRTKRAIRAGHVMACLFVANLVLPTLPDLGRSRRKPVTLTMAIKSGVRWACEMGMYGDGLFLPTDAKSWGSSFEEFRPSAHLWAAKELLPQFTSIASNHCFSEAGLQQFLSLALAIQEFGTTFELDKRSKQGSNLVLQRPTLWEIDSRVAMRANPTPEDVSSLLGTEFVAHVVSEIWPNSVS